MKKITKKKKKKGISLKDGWMDWRMDGQMDGLTEEYVAVRMQLEIYLRSKYH